MMPMIIDSRIDDADDDRWLMIIIDDDDDRWWLLMMVNDADDKRWLMMVIDDDDRGIYCEDLLTVNYSSSCNKLTCSWVAACTTRAEYEARSGPRRRDSLTSSKVSFSIVACFNTARKRLYSPGKIYEWVWIRVSRGALTRLLFIAVFCVVEIFARCMGYNL